MILRQIGKGRHIKVDAPHPFQRQGVAGYLHHHMGAPGIPHPGKESLQLIALRGGALCWNDFLPDHIGHGADEPHLGPQAAFQHLLQKQCHRGFAVGAGDTHHGHGFCRVAEEVGADQSQCQPVIFHQHIGHIQLRLFGGEHYRRPLLHSHGNKPVAVGGKAGNRRKEASGTYLPGVIGNIRNLLLRVGVGFQHRNILQ